MLAPPEWLIEKVMMTFGIGVRGGHAAWCAACRIPDGPEGATKRAEVVALRKARR